MLDPNRTLRMSDISAMAKRIGIIARLVSKELDTDDAKMYRGLAMALGQFCDKIDADIASDPVGNDLPVFIDGDYVRVGSSKYENSAFSKILPLPLLTEEDIEALRKTGLYP